MDRAVELPVTAAVQSVAGGVAGAGRDRGGAGVPGEARFGAEPLGAGGVADDDRGGDGPAAALVEQLRAVRLDQRLELGEQLLLFSVISLIRFRFAFATRSCGLRGSCPSWRASLARMRGPFSPAGRICASSSRGDLHQMPAQPVDQPDALVDRAGRGSRSAPGSRAPARPGTRPAASRSLRGARRARSRSRRSGRTSPARGPLACEDSVSAGGTRTTRSPPASSPRSSRPDTCRQSSTAHTRSLVEPARRTAARRAPLPRSPAIVSSPARLRRLPHRARQACATACVCPPRSRSCTPSLR